MQTKSLSSAQQIANFSTGSAGGLLFVSTFYIAGIAPDAYPIAVAFTASILAYVFFRPPVKSVRPFALAFLLCALGYLHGWITGYLPASFDLSKKGILYPALFVGIILFSLYAPAHFLVKKTAFGLRTTLFKNAVIAFTWAAFSLIPWMLVSPENDTGLPWWFLSRFFFVFALSLLSDVADAIPGGGESGTLTGALGFRGTQVAAFALVIVAELATFPLSPTHGTMLLPAAVAILLLGRKTKWRNEWLIDASMASHALALIAFS